MPLGGSWRRFGGRGWAAMDDQLRSGVVDDNEPFPPLNANPNNHSAPSPRPRPRPRRQPAIVDLATEHGDSVAVLRPLPSTLPISATITKTHNNTRSQHHSEQTVNESIVPVEPDEWEEDDVYLRHRKEAVKAARSASQHSKAATKAFLRGDHHAARQHSVTARHQRSAAQALHANAAANIIALRNTQNDLFSLDLHGLHALEAVQLLKQRLLLIEARDQGLKRPTTLQVITGVGNHSRGQASLPTAVRGFLNENAYYFEELKPGVVAIRPKFRLPS